MGDVGFFYGGREIRNTGEKPSKQDENQPQPNNKLNPHMSPRLNQTRALLVGGESSDHSAPSLPW